MHYSCELTFSTRCFRFFSASVSLYIKEFSDGDGRAAAAGTVFGDDDLPVDLLLQLRDV